MTRENSWSSAGLVALLLVTGPLVARGEDLPLATSSPEVLLRQMSDELKRSETFRFHAEINFDDVLVSGQKLQYAGAVDVTVKHPDGVHIDHRDDISAKRFWYDGKTATLLDLFHEKYSQIDLPGDIDSAVDRLIERYNLSLPLANLISSDVFETIEEHAIGWGYMGVHDVDGTPTHHIAIMGKNSDLQLWIQKDGPPLPLKLVVTYTNVAEAPQYQALLMDWEIGATVSADTFEPTLPKGAQQIEFLVVEGQK